MVPRCGSGNVVGVGCSTYAELHCLSNFSFLRGASHPQELVERALEHGYTALAITDECSLAGVVRAHGAIKDDRGARPKPQPMPPRKPVSRCPKIDS